MNSNDIMQGLNMLAQTFNIGTNIASNLIDQELTDEQIDGYFQVLNYIASKRSDYKYYSLILEVYESAVKRKNIEFTDNKGVNASINVVSSSADITIAKNNLSDALLATNNILVERDFNFIAYMLRNDIELILHSDLRKIMLEQTPVIKAKVKKAMKDSADISKKIADGQKYLEDNNGKYNYTK